MKPTLEALAQSPRVADRVLVASHPETPATVLTVLGNSGSIPVLRAVAGNPHTPLSTLGEIARLNDPVTLKVLQGNPSWAVEVECFAVECGVEPGLLSWVVLETLYLTTHSDCYE